MAIELLEIHLAFLTSLLDFATTQNWRVVVSGGYAIDAVLRKATRLHGDIDVLIYGKTPRLEATHMLSTHYQSTYPSGLIDLKNETFYANLDIHHEKLVANTYYIQTKLDPMVSLQTVVKDNGEVVTNSVDLFPPPVSGELAGISLEVENPHSRLKDILTKRKTLQNFTKHERDIENLKKLIDTQPYSS